MTATVLELRPGCRVWLDGSVWVIQEVGGDTTRLVAGTRTRSMATSLLAYRLGKYWVSNWPVRGTNPALKAVDLSRTDDDGASISGPRPQWSGHTRNTIRSKGQPPGPTWPGSFARTSPKENSQDYAAPFCHYPPSR